MSYYTLEKIAKKLGVSSSTVSRVINNKNNVSPKTKAKVEEALMKYEYIPNLNARGLKGSTKLIGVIFPNIMNPYFTEVIMGIEKMLRPQGYTVLYLNTNDSLEDEEKCIRDLLSIRVQGIIMISNLSPEKSKLFEVIQKNIYVVSIENYIEFADNINIDNEIGTKKALEYLYKKGHRKIGYCSKNLGYSSWKKRYDTYVEFTKEKGIFNEKYIYIGENFLEKVDKDNLPTAIFTTNDLNALEVYKWCEEQKLKIPEDISVIGFDGLNVGKVLKPKLTTIAQPILDMGEIAAECLLKRINKINKENYKRILITPNFEEGESVFNITKIKE